MNLSYYQNKYRCAWAESSPEMVRYHDRVWGKPKRRDKDIFEAIVLDAFQAGLSWKTILLRREAFAKTFHNFDPVKVSKMSEKYVTRLLKDEAIIRHRGKITATIQNAKSFLQTQKEFKTFSKYIWSFSNNSVIVNHPKHPKDMSSQTPLSIKISKDLRARGFKFVGPTMVYAFMRGIGMVDDHEEKCFCKYGK